MGKPAAKVNGNGAGEISRRQEVKFRFLEDYHREG